MSLRSYVFSALAFTVVLAGCSGARHMTPQTGGIMLDTPQSVSPGSIVPAPMAHTTILLASVMAVKPQSAIQGASWTQIPGAASYAAAAPDGSLWVLSDAPSGADKYIWHYVSGTWTNISGLASRLSVAPDGTLYAINSSGGAYSYSGGTWTGLGGGCSDVTAASDGSIYVLSNGNSAGSDQAIWHYTTSWSQVPGAGVRIAASWDPNSFTLSNGTVSANGLYVLNSAGSIYYENPNNSFVQLPGNASAIAPTTIGGVFALGYPTNSDGNGIYYYDLNAQGWSVQSGAGVSISTDSTHLYVIGSTGGIYSSPVKAASRTITEYPGPLNGSGGIAAGPDGNLWFTYLGGYGIGKITPGGTMTGYPICTGTCPGGGVFLYGIAAGPDGNMWFTGNNGSNDDRIGKITPNGTVTQYAIGCCGQDPFKIAAGPDGNLWFTEQGNSIGKITTGGTITEYPIPTASSAPTDIAAGPDGNLWFTETVGNKIGKITPSGTFTEYVIPTANAYPYGIAAGPDGNLWFTEDGTGANKIGKITPSGAFTEYSLPLTSNADPGPHGITAGPEGNLWFTEPGSNKIGKITTGGTITEYVIPGIPESIAAGPDGNLWFTVNNSNGSTDKIGKITP
ncbi:MAG TPA: tectonin domain-containing protein [Candidatus Baltobacteraceae bacterium]